MGQEAPPNILDEDICTNDWDGRTAGSHSLGKNNAGSRKSRKKKVLTESSHTAEVWLQLNRLLPYSHHC